jgi:aryl-alcohol dehydrogenase-like predicted oxidoreductase
LPDSIAIIDEKIYDWWVCFKGGSVMVAALGRSVSRLGYGAWGIAGAFGAVDPRTAVRSVLTYLEADGNLIDTAREYGESEALVGKALRERSGEAPVVATKILSHGPRERWGRPLPVDIVFPRGSIRTSLERSLRELGREHVDLVQLHLYWPTWGVDGYWLDELRQLQSSGKILAIGVSVPDYRHDVALELVASGSVNSVQTVVNIFDSRALDCLAPRAADNNVALIGRGVLDESGLAGVVEEETDFAVGDFRREFFTARTRREYVERIDELRAWVPGTAPSLAALAIRFVLSQPQVTSAIVSMQTEDLVRQNMALLDDEPFPRDVLDRLGTRHRWTRNFFEHLYWQDG